MRDKLQIALFVFVVGFAGAAVGQAPSDRPSDQPPRDEAAPRREGRRDDEPPPPPKQKGKELFERDFPGPRDGGRPGGDKGGSPKGKAGPGDRRPGEESSYEELVRQQSEAAFLMHDRNRDRKLDRSEWAYPNDFEKVDRDDDGFITLDELIKAPRTLHAGPGTRGPSGIPIGPNGEMPGHPGYGDAAIRGGRVFGRGPMMPGMPGMPGPFGEGPGDDPEMRELMSQDAEMDRKARELSMRVRESRGEERTKLKAELQNLVNKHFDVRQQRRELQLKRMEDELQRLREAISSRNKSRESIVTSHMKELIGEERDLEF